MGRKGKGELIETLKRFNKDQLTQISNMLGLSPGNSNRDAIMDQLLSKKPNDVKIIDKAYDKLDGVSINVLLREIYRQDNELGHSVEACKRKNDVVTNLFISGKIKILDQVADYARFEKKKKSSPLVFIGQLQETMSAIEMEAKVKELVQQLNEGRPNKLYFEDLVYSPTEQVLKIRLSREIGRRHIRQRPNRSPSAEMIEHDDYPLKTYILDIDFKANNVKTTFKENEADGLQITKKILDNLVKDEAELKSTEFLCNPLDTNQTQIIHDRISSLQQHLPQDSGIFRILDLVKDAKRTGLTIKGLNLEGDLQKLEIKAGEVDRVLKALNLDCDILMGARNMDYELELQDDKKRKVRVVKTSITFTGNFTDEEKNTIQDILKGP